MLATFFQGSALRFAEGDALNARRAGSGFRLVVGGRLGSYRYFDMDKSVEAALAVPLE